MKIPVKAAVGAIAIVVIAVTFILVSRSLPEVREAKEASMLKFLHFHLLEYGLGHQHYPESLEAAIQDGLLDDFPKGRIEYLESAIGEQRIRYFLSKEGRFSLSLTTCRGREITMEGFPNEIREAQQGAGADR